MFLTYVIKADKRELLSLYFKPICELLLFMAFPGKLPLFGKMNNFGSYHIFVPLDQVNLICF